MVTMIYYNMFTRKFGCFCSEEGVADDSELSGDFNCSGGFSTCYSLLSIDTEGKGGGMGNTEVLTKLLRIKRRMNHVTFKRADR